MSFIKEDGYLVNESDALYQERIFNMTQQNKIVELEKKQKKLEDTIQKLVELLDRKK